VKFASIAITWVEGYLYTVKPGFNEYLFRSGNILYPENVG